ncbi:MAG: energy transducer TonB [Pseudomonadales bacterium]|nr:energy transducer TonB [Pseudomonadales bacterium]
MGALTGFARNALKFGALLAAAFVATVGCFYLMHALITVRITPVESEPLRVSASVNPRQNFLQTREIRQKPQKLLPMEPPPGLDIVAELRSSLIAEGKSTLLESLADDLDPTADDVRFKAPKTDLVALKVVRPVYPLFAVNHQIEGHVLVQFGLKEDGSVINPFVLESRPKDIFDRAALEAIRQFRFEPPPSGEERLLLASGILRFAFELESTQGK